MDIPSVKTGERVSEEARSKWPFISNIIKTGQQIYINIVFALAWLPACLTDQWQ